VRSQGECSSKSKVGLEGERSVGVCNKEEVTDAGEKSGDLSRLRTGFFANGAGELRLRVRRSCSTCYTMTRSVLDR
jgi:hypothetical protein